MATRNAPTSTTKPRAQRPDFDLDALEVDEGQPLLIKVGGRNVTFMSPDSLDWRVVRQMDVRNPGSILDHVIAPEDVEFFESQSFSIAKLKRLVEFYLDHYGVNPGESPA